MKQTSCSILLLVVLLVMAFIGCDRLPLGPTPARDNPFDPGATEVPSDGGDGGGEPIDPAKIYYAKQYGPVGRCSPDGTNQETVTTSVTEIWCLAVDETNGLLFGADEGVETVFRSTLLGLNAQTILDVGSLSLFNVHSVAVDPVHGFLFLADDSSGQIYRCALDGASPEDITPPGVTNPLGLSVDIGAAKLYWVDYGTQKIQRSNLDGGGLEDLITSVTDPVGLALDTANGKMYWTDWTNDHIRRANLDGTGVETIVTGLSDPWEIIVDPANNRIFFSEYGGARIRSADLDGGDMQTIVSGVTEIRGIAFYSGQ